MLSIFIMHACVFVLIRPNTDTEQAVAAALAPFDDALVVEPYRLHLGYQETLRMARQYGIDPADLYALAEKMPDWTGNQGGVDRFGLYELAKFNPDGRWDWHTIGGRWNGYIPRSRDNAILAGTLAKSRSLGRCLPCYLVTPDSHWLLYQQFYLEGDWEKLLKLALKKGAWLRMVRQTLQRWPDHRVVCVDIHF